MAVKPQKMLILTGLYFNKVGNQSMLNSVIGYAGNYDVVVLTAADLGSPVYISKDDPDIMRLRVQTVSIWPYRSLGVLKKIVAFFMGLISAFKTRSDGGRTESSEFKNSGSGLLTRIAFRTRAALLLLGALGLRLFIRPEVVCFYEINALPNIKILRLFFRGAVFFGKFQGTILGPSIRAKIDKRELESIYPLDAWAMPYARFLDAAIMTNDGTYGDVVLNHFGCNPEKQLFLPNGVDERILAERLKLQQQPDLQRLPYHRPIITVSLSRLVGWKRVPTAIRAVDSAVSRGSNIRHLIIGGGSASEISAITDTINSAKNRNSFEHLGALSFEETIRRLKCTDLLISVYRESNVCNPVLEALALGIPVLTIRESALESVLGSAVSGCILVSEKDADALEMDVAEELCKISVEKLIELRAKALEAVPFSWKARQIEEAMFIRKLMGQNNES